MASQKVIDSRISVTRSQPAPREHKSCATVRAGLDAGAVVEPGAIRLRPDPAYSPETMEWTMGISQFPTDHSFKARLEAHGNRTTRARRWWWPTGMRRLAPGCIVGFIGPHGDVTVAPRPHKPPRLAVPHGRNLELGRSFKESRRSARIAFWPPCWRR